MEEAARSAFDAYLSARAVAYGSTQDKMYEENRNWPSFLEIGKLCIDNGWTPKDFVLDVFSALSSNGGLVLPSNMTTKAAAAFYKKRKEASEFSPEELWTASEATLTELVVNGVMEKQVLQNPMLAFPAWFRVFYPEELDSDIVATYGTAARSEMTPAVEAFVATKNRRSLDTFHGLWQSSQPPTNQNQPC